MMRIKKITRSIVTALFLFLLSGFFALSAQAAPRLYFEPSPVNLPNGVETEIKLQIDAESNSIFGADAVINFPSSDLTIVSVTNGGFFSDFSYAPSTGKLEIHGFFSSAFDSKSGAGTMTLIKVKGNKSSGAGLMSFTCTGSGETEILRASDGQNILSCNSLSSLTLSYGSGSSDNNGTGGNQNTNDPNATNACGGTCGSVYNCNAGLYCYSGFCRNPDCPTSLTCGCTATVKPTSTAKPKSSGKPTPEIVVLTKNTASPSATPNSTVAPENESSPKVFDLKKIGIWTGITILLLALLSLIASLFKGKGKPPVNPPTMVTNVEPPLSSPVDTSTPWQPPQSDNPPQTPPTVQDPIS